MNGKYMELALKEAKKAYKSGEVPVGAVIVRNDKIIAKAHNIVENKKNSTLHAEIVAISKASKKIKNWRLTDCDIYVTLEPCDMCSGAIALSRIENVFFAVSRDSNKVCNRTKNIVEMKEFSEDALQLIQSFFSKKRS